MLKHYLAKLKGDFKGDPIYHQLNVTDLKMSIYAKDKSENEYILKNIACILFDQVTVVRDESLKKKAAFYFKKSTSN
jgi:hypothetical protein